MFGGTKSKDKIGKKKRIIFIVSSGMLVVAIAFAAIFLMDSGIAEDAIEFTGIPNGVSVNGVDISCMTNEQVVSAIVELQEKMLDNYICMLECSGEIFEYTADDFNVSTNYEEVLAQALAAKSAEEFTVIMTADTAAVGEVLAQLKHSLDAEPINATMTFMPWGYFEDGTAYEPDLTNLAEANAKGKRLEHDDLVRNDDADTINKLRYQFWDNDEYVSDYTPADADVARFAYTPGETGISVDTDAAYDAIMAQVNSGEFSTITVPMEDTEPEITLESLKNDTQLITSWTSSYSGSHDYYKRNWNVSRMSSFVNDIIEPGEEWSINETAGSRNATTAREIGWKKAPGLYQGATTQQYGGGVCQLGSTTYNAALRADLTIVKFHHHSDASGYIPKGLDATLDYPSINSNRKDLVLRNDGKTPVYLVSYVEPEKTTVTVEVYGRLPYNDAYGQQVIYDYTSDNKGTRYGMGRVIPVYATKTPKGDVLTPENPTIVFSSPKAGCKVKVYKHIYALDGTELDIMLLRVSNYKPINGYTYFYPPDLMPTPTPGDPTPTPGGPIPTPGDPTPTPGGPTPTP